MSELFRPVQLDGKAYRLTPAKYGRESSDDCQFDLDATNCVNANAQQTCVPSNPVTGTIHLKLIFKEVTS